MAEQYDGSIRINTEIDTRDVNSQMLRLTNEIKKTTREITDLKEKMDSLAKSNVPTDEYKQMQAELKKAETYADRLYGRLRVMEKSGDTTSAGYRRLVNQIKIADQQIDNLRDGVLQLEASGKAFIPGANTAEYKKMAQQGLFITPRCAIFYYFIFIFSLLSKTLPLKMLHSILLLHICLPCSSSPTVHAFQGLPHRYR